MNKYIVQKINGIVREWKSGYIDAMNNFSPKLNLGKDLATESYAKILNTTMKGFASLDLPPHFFYIFSMRIIDGIYRTIGGFDRNYKVDNAFSNIFKAPIRVANSFMFKNPEVDDKAPPLKEQMIVIPAGETATGKPLGMKNIGEVPGFIEMFFVSDNENALAVEDTLYFDFHRAFTMKAVPELPPEMIEYAKLNNLPMK
jgi:hypothetical protein